MALSLAQDAKRALYDALVTALPDVKVFVGGAIDRPEECVVIGPQDRPLTFDQEWRGFGAGSTRTEELAIPVSVIVYRGGEDEFTAEDRSWELAEHVADWLATRPLEQFGIHAGRPDRGEQVTAVFKDGRESTITFNVTCEGVARGI